MSEQDGVQSSKQHRNRRTNATNHKNSKQTSPLQRPTTDDPEAWKAYWEAQELPWRTEPEIAAERQAYLAERRTIAPDIEQGSYPFKDIPLSRADVEWLLATHENGRGPVDWSDTNMWRRRGLDLRGADLRHANLNNLPLTRMQGGLSQEERHLATVEQCETAEVHLEGANLHWAHLERASLFGACLTEANLSRAHLEEAFLVDAHLERANLTGARLEKSYLSKAHLEEAELFRAHLEGTFLNGVHLEKANLREAHLEGAGLRLAHLEGADLRGAFFDPATNLENVIFGQETGGFALLADVRWGGVNLAVVNWGKMKILGDEYVVQQKREQSMDQNALLTEYEAAVRANRQLAVALQTQGLNEVAARFAYHAQLCQKYVLFLQLRQHLKQQIHIPWLAALLFVEKPQGKRAEQRIAEMILMLGSLLFGFGLLLSSHVPTGSILFSSDTRGAGTFILLATIFGIVFIGLSIVGLFFYVTPEASLALFFLFMSLLQVLIPIGAYLLVNALLSHVDWLLLVALSIWILSFIVLARGRLKFHSWFFLTRKMSNSLARLFSKFRPLVGVQIAYGRYIFAWFLDLLAGYGYRPGRSVIAYLLVIGGFASLYTTFGHLHSFPDAIVFSLASFHGRGFFPNFEGQQQLPLSNPLVVCAAFEALIGLIIEISFIATFTQRYFGK